MRALLFLLLLPVGSFAQTAIEGRVLDATTRQPLPYCSVGVQGTTHGALTNADGVFQVEADTLRDTLRFSYIGYRTTGLPALAVLRQRDVLLPASSTQLAQVEVFPDDALYERVIRAARWLRSLEPASARAYFELETHLDTRPVEVVECFYNARLDGARISGLDLKHGRIGIAPMGDRFFVSLNTTKAISLFDPTAHNDLFPMSPMQWTSVRKLRRSYSVEIVSSSVEEGVDHLHLAPRDSTGIAFSADLWLDANTDAVRVLELGCTHCAEHPFVPLWNEHAINGVDLRFRQTWRTWENRSVLDHVELDYTLDYANDTGPERIDTKAVLHVFDPGGAFILPLFDYDREQSDYRKITFQPYDSAFWSTAPALVRTAQQERDRDFFKHRGLLTGSSVPEEWRSKSFFESNYAWWSAKKRISLKSLPPPPEDATRPADIQSKGTSAPISQVNLEAQIFLDIDTAHGVVRTFSATVLDGFRSYYHLPEQVYTDCFINLFFDLCEMERRKMDEQLHAPGIGVDGMRAIHAEAVAQMHRTTQRYIREVKLGADRIALQRWNAVVKDALGIDNIALFGL